MSISGLSGHAPVAAQLQRALREDRLPHAILLTGPEAVGKTTLARAIAAEALDVAEWPGGLAAHPDHWEEDGDGERIGIERVRTRGRGDGDDLALQDFLSVHAYAGGRRVALIGRADRLTEQAANCLLKTIEEPPASTHLLLTTAHPERLPATILSRCQQIACSPVPAMVVRDWLIADHGVGPELAETAAALAGGRPGRGLRLATEPGALRAEVAAIDAFLRIGGSGPGGALRAAGELAPAQGAAGRERALGQVAAWTGFVRDAACLAGGAPELPVWGVYRSALEGWGATLGPARLVTILGRLVETAEHLAQYAIPRLTYEVLFLDIFTTAPVPPLVELARTAVVSGPADAEAPAPLAPRRPSRARKR